MSDTIAPPRNETDEEAAQRMADNPQDTDYVRYPETGRPETEPQPGEAPAGVPPTPPAHLPDDGGDEPEEEKEPLLFLLGHKQLGVKVGGFKPDSSTLAIEGGKIDLAGQFDLGERFPAVFTLQVTGNLDRHSIERDSGTVKGQKRKQEATVCGTATLASWLAMQLEVEHPELLGQVLSALDLAAEGEGI